jgi:hypothetical protein
MVKVGDMVQVEGSYQCGTVRAVYPVHNGSGNWLADVRVGPQNVQVFNVRNLRILDRSVLRWRKAQEA